MTLGLFSCLSLVSAFGTEPALEIGVSGDWLNFRIEGTSTKDTWVLQHSTEGVIWEDLIFRAFACGATCLLALRVVEVRGFEPLAFSLRTRRSTN